MIGYGCHNDMVALFDNFAFIFNQFTFIFDKCVFRILLLLLSAVVVEHSQLAKFSSGRRFRFQT